MGIAPEPLQLQLSRISTHFLCYTASVRNITLSIPDELYRQVRVKAAEMDRSVSALVRDYLTRLVREDLEFDRRLALQEQVLREIVSFRGADRLSRNELHER